MNNQTLLLGDDRFDLTHRVLVIGVLNRTTDSFWDGGRYYGLDAALAHAEQLVEDGADVVDIGARAGGVGVSPADCHWRPVDLEGRGA